MPEITAHAPGTFCWTELATTNQEGAVRFYGALFGWLHEDHPIGEGATYSILRKGLRDTAALYGMDTAMREQGVPSAWLNYVSVESVDASAARARELGGEIVMGPMDVMEHGRMAVVRDPQGAVFALWEPKAHIGVGVVAEPGAMCWQELGTTDAKGAERFYGGLFGWRAAGEQMGSEGGMYYMWLRDGHEAPIGGMYELSGPMAGMPPLWLVYFAVEDCDRAAELAGSLGGSVVIPPTDIPDVGRFAYLKDPQGALFGVIKLAQM